MSSWVRYSVAVYLGLLISGALARQPVHAPSADPSIAPSVYYDVPTPGNTSPAMPDPTEHDNPDVSV